MGISASIYHSLTMTTPDDPAYENVPSQWNTAHLVTISYNASVGLNTAATNVTWTVNSSGISLNAGGYLTTARASTDGVGLNTAQTNVTWTVNSSGISLNAAGYAGTGTSATNASVTLNSAGLAISVAAPSGLTNIKVSAGTLSALRSDLTFADSNGISFGLNTDGKITGTVQTNYLTTARASTDAVGLNTAATNVTWTVNSSGISLNAGAYLTTARASNDAIGLNTAATNVTWTVNSSGISLNAGAYLTTARGSTDAIGLNTAQTNVTWTVNSSGISLNAAGYAGTGTSITGNASITLDSGGLKFNGSGLAGTSTGATNATVTLNSSGIAVSVGNYITTARASTDAIGLNTAATNVTWTVNSSGLSLNAGGYAGTATSIVTVAGTDPAIALNSGGLTLSYPKAITTARASTDAIGLNTAQTNVTWTVNSGGLSLDAGGYAGTGTSTGTTVGTNIKVTLNTNGISILNPEPYISIFEPEPYAVSSTMNIANGVSISHAQFFQLPQNGSFSFIRIPVSFTTNSTTLSTAAASLSASARVGSTWNAVVYQMDTGANSRSLTWVASGSAGFTFLNSISMAADGTSGSYTQAFSYPVEGVQSSTSTQWSSGNTNMGLSTTVFHSLYSGHRFLDIPFANSLSAGPYWIIMGWSSSSATNSARFAATNCIISASYYMGMSRGSNAATGIMGSTNRTSAYPMVGSFSTAGGGTTAALPISAISTVASNARFYCMFIRSA